MNGEQIKYSVGFNIDKTALNELKASLQSIKSMTAGDLMKINNTSLEAAQKDLKQIQQSVGVLEGALNKAFNTNLGTLNVSKFNQELKKIDLNKLYQDFTKAGSAGQAAFRNTTAQILTTNMQLKQTNSLLDSMATTMANTVKWGVASSVMNSFTGAVQKAYGYVKDLDRSLNDIRIVTGQSADEMAKFAVQANNAAKQLGQTTTTYTDAALIYYQQGLQGEEVRTRTETTLKAANVTGQTGAEVSEQLTAVWNGYKVSAEETELYVDKLAAVAASTAADLEELSTGMSKVASAASTAGVDIDQLNATLATVVSVTRQAPESVGTAFKTIYARLGDLAVDGVDEFGTTLGEVSSKLETMGIQVLDQQGDLRDMGTVVEEVAAKWDTWTSAQKQAAAVAMAGKRQYNNLIALFENWDMYEEALQTSADAAGTLQEQQDIYMESTEAHLKQLKASAEDVYDSILKPKAINNVVDVLTEATDAAGNFIDAIGGGPGVLLLLGSVATKVFGKQIASSLATTITNFKNAKQNVEQLSAEMEILNQFKGINLTDSRTQQLVDMKRQELELSKSLTVEERNIANEYINQTNELFKQQDALKTRLQDAQALVQQLTGVNINANTTTGQTQGLEQLKIELDYFKSHSKDIQEIQQARAALRRTNQEDAQALQNYNSVVETQVQNAQELLQMDKLQTKEREALTQAIEKYNKVVGQSNNFDAKNQAHKNAAIQVQEAYEKAINGTIQKIEQSIQVLKTHDDALKNNAAALDNARTAWNNFINGIDLKNKIQQFTTFLGSVSQFAMALNSLGQIKKIWDNDDLSVGEKTLQLTTSLTMGVSMLGSSLINLMPTITKTFKLLSGSVAKEILHQAALEQAITREIQLYATKHAIAIEQIDKETRAKIVSNTIQKFSNDLSKKSIAQKTMELIIDKLHLKELKKILATEVALFGLKKLTMPLGAIIAGVAAAIAATAIAVYSLVKAYNAEAEALEKANESLERQTEITSRLREEHKALQELIEGYEEAYNSINNLKKGTEEYSQAIAQANEKAVELIETLGLFGQWEYGEDGLIVIKQDAVQNAYDQKTKDVATSEINLQAAYQRVNNANWELSKKKNHLNYYSDDYVQDFANLSDELYAELKNLISLDLGHKEYLSKLTDLEEQYGTTNFSLGILANTIKSLGDDADKTRNQLQELIVEESDRNEQIAKSIAKYENLFDRNELAINAYGNLVSQNKEFQETVKENSTIANQNVNNLQLKPLLEKYEGGKTWDYFGISDQELAKYYAKYVEKWTDDEIKKAKYDKGKGEGTLTSGEKTFHMEDEDMRQDLMQALLSLNLSEGLDKDGKKAYNDVQIQNTINSILNSNLEQSTQNAVLTAMSNYDESKKFEGLDLSLIHPNDMQTLLSQAEELGGDLGVALTEKLNSVSSEEQQELYNNRIEEQHSQNIDDQAQAEGLSTDVLERQTELILENTEALEGNENAAKQLAVNNALMNKGMETLIDNWEDWGKVLKKGDKTSTEYAETIDEVSTCLEDLVGLSDGMGKDLSSSFFDSAENLALLDEAAKGSEKAVEELGYAVAENLTNNMDFDAEGWAAKIAEMGEAFEGIQFSDGLATSAAEMQTHFDTAKAAVLSGIEQIKNAELGVGDNLANALTPEDLSNFVSGLNDMAIATGMSVQEMQGMLNSLGLQATVTTTSVPTTYQVPIMRTEEQIINNGENGEPIVKESKTWQVGTESETGIMDVAQISYDGNTPGAAPITKIGRGSVSTGNKGKSGGGGGGGSKSKPKKQDKITDDIDRYHDINIKIEDLSRSYDRLADAQERLMGEDLVDNLNAQLDILDKQVAAAKEKLAIEREEQKELQAKLAAEGVQFDSNGLIANYKAILQAKQNEYNALVDQYNAMSADKQEEFQERLDQAEEEYEEFKEWIERYDEIVTSEIPDLVDEITQAAYDKIELQIEKFNVEVELRLDVKEALNDWRDFEEEILKNFGDDEFLKRAEYIRKNIFDDWDSEGLSTKLVDNLTRDIKAITDDINVWENGGTPSSDRFATKDANGKLVFNETLAYDTLNDRLSELYSTIGELYEDADEIREAYIGSIEASIDATNEYYDSLDRINDTLEHTKEVITLIKGEEAFSEIGEVLNEQIDLSQKKLADLTADIKKYQDDVSFYEDEVAKYKELEREALSSNNEALAAYYKAQGLAAEEALKISEEALNESLSNRADAVEEHLQLIQEKYENTINEANKALEDWATNGLGFEGMEKEWEHHLDVENQYLDAVNRAFELRSLEADINEKINDTDSLSVQKRLNEFKEKELAALKEKDKLTKYDVERAEKLLDIELKKIALEEAQQNKSRMRLRRDASGNYSYQFVADENNISEAQRELDEAQNSLYNFDKERAQELISENLDLWKDYEDFRVWYSEQSAEFRAENEDWFVKECAKYEQQLIGNAGLATEAMKNTYSSAMGEVVTVFDTSMTTMIEKINSDENGFKKQASEAMGAVTSATSTLNTELGSLATILGAKGPESLTQVTSDYYTLATTAAGNYAGKQKENVKYANEEVQAMKDLNHELDLLIGKTGSGTSTADVVDAGVDAAKQATDMIKGNKIKEADEIGGVGQGTTETSAPKQETTSQEKKQEEKPKAKEEKTSTSKKQISVGGKINAGNAKIYDEIDSKGRHQYFDEDPIYTVLKQDGNWIQVRHHSLKKGVSGWFRKGDVSAYDTGGYTGNWSGRNGKLAFLHKKELVLNEKDTENMLKAIQALRYFVTGTELDNLKRTRDLINLKDNYEEKLTNNEMLERYKKALDEKVAENTSGADASALAMAKSLKQYFNEMNKENEYSGYSNLVSKKDAQRLTELIDEMQTSINDFESENLVSLVKQIDTLHQRYNNELSIQSLAEQLNNMQENIITDRINQISSFDSQINQTVSSLNHALTNRMDSMINTMEPLIAGLMTTGGGQPQQVEIYADFPNATDAAQIEDAFKNLVNSASQYAFANKR